MKKLVFDNARDYVRWFLENKKSKTKVKYIKLEEINSQKIYVFCKE